MRVLYLGATGIVGRQVVPNLQDKYELTLGALGGGEIGGLTVADVDITDLKSIEALAKAGHADGQPFDAIVNCAIAPHTGIDRSTADKRNEYYENCIDVNARGAYHVYEAAARAAVPRVVYISSMTVVLGPPVSPVCFDASTPEHPTEIYGACKLFGEHVGRYFAYRSNKPEEQMRVLCLRLGQPYKSFQSSDEIWQTAPRLRGLTTDCRDIAHAVDCALRADIVFGVYTIVSESDQGLVAPELYEELGFKSQWKFTAEGLFPVNHAAEGQA